MSSNSVIHLSSDVLRATVLPQGATLASLRFADAQESLVLAFADPMDHAAQTGCIGNIVGPVANRVRHGRVVLDGTTHQMPLNENGRTCLHSGSDGLHTQMWEVAAVSDSDVTLRIALADGAQGLPGNRVIEASYGLAGHVLTLDMRAWTDRTTAMNVAHHPYWNLDGAANIAGHQLQINAEHFLPTDSDNLPTGTRTPLPGSAFDFSALHPVPMDPALDVNFCLSDVAFDAPQPAATLVGADGTKLETETTAPGLQAYSGAHLPTLPAALEGGGDLGPYAGLALEPQYWPDAPHHPDFPQITLHPDHEWRQVTRYILSAPPD